MVPISEDSNYVEPIRCMDAGASSHFTRYRQELTDYVTIKPLAVRAANKTTFTAIGRGTLTIDLPFGDSKTRVVL
ncbi:hypothetical protein DENSPDRAFT_780217, partial [Dentipellis sp. KUC8613]